MIKKNYLFPEFYIMKRPFCDDCNIELVATGTTYMSNPPLLEYRCPSCNRVYNIQETELRGEWKWRTL